MAWVPPGWLPGSGSGGISSVAYGSSGVVTTTALDIVVGALRNIGALEAGETPSSQDSTDALQVLNDLLDQWSIEHLYVFASAENTFSFTPGTYQYSVGNPSGGTFTGILTNGSPTITSVTVPANMIVGGDLADIQSLIPAGTTIQAIGSSTITMSANALGTSGASEVIAYTVPGAFKMTRPLRITNAFTRITASGSTQLDYQMAVIPRDKYTALGIKGLPGPWPTHVYYDPTYPLGTLYFYPNPSQAGVLHLWTDQIFSSFTTISQALNLPQGYAMALKKNLALQLAPEYGKGASPLLVQQARDSKNAIKALNATPAVQAFFDKDILKSNRHDAGWIMHGGFNT